MLKSFLPILTAAFITTYEYAQAAQPIRVQTQGFAGMYEIFKGQTKLGRYMGDQTLSLEAGEYQFTNLTTAFGFHVDDQGTVTSLHPESARGGASSLELQLLAVNVDPQAYDRYYQPYGGSRRRGRTVVLSIIGLEDRLWTTAGNEITRYRVEPDQSVSLLTGTDSVDAVGTLIQFRNTDFNVDPRAYSRRYEVYGTKVTGPASWIAIPGVEDRVLDSDGTTIADFVVDSAGSIRIIRGERRVSVHGGTIQFENVSISVDPGNYEGIYQHFGSARTRGPSQSVAIPFVEDRIVNGSGSTVVRYIVDPAGKITIVEGSRSAEVSSRGKLRLLGVSVTIEPVLYQGRYQFYSGIPLSGTQSMVVLPHVMDHFTFDGRRFDLTVSDRGIEADGTVKNPLLIADLQALRTVGTDGLSWNTSSLVFRVGNVSGMGHSGGALGCGRSAHASGFASTARGMTATDAINTPFVWAVLFIFFREGFKRIRRRWAG